LSLNNPCLPETKKKMQALPPNTAVYTPLADDIVNGPALQLFAADGSVVEISRKAAQRSVYLRGLIEDAAGGDLDGIPLEKIAKGDTLQRVVAYLELFKDDLGTNAAASTNTTTTASVGSAALHAALSPSKLERPLKKALSDYLTEAERGFINNSDEVNFAVAEAATFLQIESLVELLAAWVASELRGKTPEEMRKRFNIENDFTPEEEKQIREQFKWAFES
jgi:S-phase kinase-associated protein 1